MLFGCSDAELLTKLVEQAADRACRGPRARGLVFGRNAELPFDYTSTMNRAKRAWRRAGAAAISLHQARHTFALLIDADVNAKAISTFMGHSSIAITIDRYGHLMPGSEDEAAARIDAYLERANTLARLAQVDPRGPVVGQSALQTSGFQRITADTESAAG